MTYEEICKLLDYDEDIERSTFYMPNEIFEDLKSYITNSPHIAFSYSYIYLIFWLWRNTKYFNEVDIIDNKTIKRILGYNPNTQGLDYIIKKNGLLDQCEYTESTRSYPMSWSYTEDEGFTFFMSSEIDETIKDKFPEVPKRFFLKKPLKGFNRVLVENGVEYEILGTFQAIENTHMIDFNVFLFCMSNEKLGCISFYLYCYLKYRSDIKGIEEEQLTISLENLSKDSGITKRTLDKYLNALKGYRMIDFNHNQDFFVLGLGKDDRESNSYSIRSYREFNFEDAPLAFDRIEVVERVDYFKMLEEEKKMLASPLGKVFIKESSLPF